MLALCRIGGLEVAALAGLLLVDFHAFAGLACQSGPDLSQGGHLWDLEHFLLLPCQFPAGDAELAVVGIIGIQAPSLVVEPTPSLNPSRAPPA